MALRKSARLTARQEASAASAEEVSPRVAPSTSHGKTSTRPQKKQKNSAPASKKAAFTSKKNAPTAHDNAPTDTTDYRRVKGVRGKLKLMTEMPLDILLEIFSELAPLDLLHISRATKDLRTIVTSPTHAFLWTRVYASAPAPVPPPCPPGMSFLHYTNLIYGRHCQFCASIHGRIVHWASRVRLCSKCVPSKLLKKHAPGPKVDNDALALTYPFYMRKAGGLSEAGVYALVVDYKRQVETLAKAKLAGEEAVRDYKAQRIALVNQRSKDIGPLCQWSYELRGYHSQQQEAARNNRQQRILDKLREEGYTEAQPYSIWSLPGVRVAIELTDKEWEVIKYDIINALENNRRRAKERDMQHTFYRRLSHLRILVTEATKDIPAPRILPPIAQIANCQPFLALLKGTSISDGVTMEQVRALADHIPGILASWRDQCDEILLGLIPEAEDMAGDVGKRPLELATTLFKCFGCDEPITYPRILVHSCVRSRISVEATETVSEKPNKQDQKPSNSDEEDSDDEEDDAKDDAEEPSGQAARTSFKREVDVDAVWNRAHDGVWDASNDRILFDEEASGFARVIIQAFGEAQTVTRAQMDDKNGRIECVSCRVDGKKPKRLVMNWTTAILHDLEYHFEDPPNQEKWQLLTDEVDVAKAKETEVKLGKRWRYPAYQCRHCERYPIHGKYIKDHLDGHKIVCEGSAYDLSQHVIPLLDTSIRMPPYAVKIQCL